MKKYIALSLSTILLASSSLVAQTLPQPINPQPIQSGDSSSHLMISRGYTADTENSITVALDILPWSQNEPIDSYTHVMPGEQLVLVARPFEGMSGDQQGATFDFDVQPDVGSDSNFVATLHPLNDFTTFSIAEAEYRVNHHSYSCVVPQSGEINLTCTITDANGNKRLFHFHGIVEEPRSEAKPVLRTPDVSAKRSENYQSVDKGDMDSTGVSLSSFHNTSDNGDMGL